MEDLPCLLLSSSACCWLQRPDCVQTPSSSAQSSDALLSAGSGTSPKAAAGKAALQQQKRSSWFSFKQTGATSTELLPGQRLSPDLHLDGAPSCFACVQHTLVKLRRVLSSYAVSCDNGMHTRLAIALCCQQRMLLFWEAAVKNKSGICSLAACCWQRHG